MTEQGLRDLGDVQYGNLVPNREYPITASRAGVLWVDCEPCRLRPECRSDRACKAGRARLKPLIDGLRDAGVIANDTRGFIEHGPVTEERGFVGVLLIVEEV